mgnify:FL=1
MIFGRTDIGLVREANEDTIFYDDGFGMMIVADGIGGHARGDEASQTAVETIKSFIYKQINFYSDKQRLLKDAFHKANLAVHAIQENLEAGAICGTTLTCALLSDGYLYFAHIGDTRIYVSRGKEDIEQITFDHTYISELARNDFKTFVELQSKGTLSSHNYLTKAIGPDETVEPQVGRFRLMPNDYIILLTDGIYRYIKPLDVLKMLKNTDNIHEFVDSLMKTALDMGGKDNLSVVVGVFPERGVKL